MVDLPRLAALLERIRTEIDAVRTSLQRSDTELTVDPDALPAIKYRLVVAIEAAIDAADHIIASEGLQPAQTYADTFVSLQRGGWLEPDLTRVLKEAAGFRNLLVHQYAEVDDARVLEIARSRLDDLDRFRRAIAARLV